MYAVFLEHLLTNVRSLLVADEQRRTAWRTFNLWINFPALMWSRRRGSLRREAEGSLPALELSARDSAVLLHLATETTAEVERPSQHSTHQPGSHVIATKHHPLDHQQHPCDRAEDTQCRFCK
jgi:hypothetical protein